MWPVVPYGCEAVCSFEGLFGWSNSRVNGFFEIQIFYLYLTALLALAVLTFDGVVCTYIDGVVCTYIDGFVCTHI